MAIEFQQARLNNGLTVVAEINPAAHTSAVGFFVKTGARDEAPALMGVSHFLEHMMFKGTDRRSADEVNREFDQIGANYNAFTSHEKTVYYAQVLPKFLPDAVDLFGDMLRPALREADFDVEKKVILEEIGMYEDRPEWRLQDMLLEKFFADHPLGHRVLGTTGSVEKLSADQMRSYFEKRYSSDNITVSAAGQIDWDQLLGDLEAIAGAWRPSGATRCYDRPIETAGEYDLIDAKLNRHYVAALCPGPSAQDDQRYAARILADVLGDDEGSHLYWALVDPGLADDADFSFLPQDRVGCFMAFAACAPAQGAEVEQRLWTTIDAFNDRLEDRQVQRAKNKLATLAALQEESPMGRMQALGAQWLAHGRYQSLTDELDRLMAVTTDDVRRLFESTPIAQRTVVRLKPV